MKIRTTGGVATLTLPSGDAFTTTSVVDVEVPFVPRPFSLRHLQQHLPWTIQYSLEFEGSAASNPLRRVGHDVLHVMKSLGRIAAEIEARDHNRLRKLEGEAMAKEVADFVICALHIAKLEGFDLQDAVVKYAIQRNAKPIPPEAEWSDKLNRDCLRLKTDGRCTAPLCSCPIIYPKAEKS